MPSVAKGDLPVTSFRPYSCYSRIISHHPLARQTSTHFPNPDRTCDGQIEPAPTNRYSQTSQDPISFVFFPDLISISNMSNTPSEIEQKRDRLLEILKGYRQVAVAFSAGVDSTVVAGQHISLAGLMQLPSLQSVSVLRQGNGKKQNNSPLRLGFDTSSSRRGSFPTPDTSGTPRTGAISASQNCIHVWSNWLLLWE